MTPDIPGQLLIWYALAANIIAGLAWFLAARGSGSWSSLGVTSYRVFAVATMMAAAYLFYLFFAHDFRVKYVFEYSDRSLPFFYLLSGLWAGQEGSYLLWLIFSACFGFVIVRHGGRYRDHAMAVYCGINLFLLVLLTRVSPFALLTFPVEDGAGLNPLLQDPWMVIHPPVIFAGYAAAAIPFAVALAALWKNDYSEWVARVFPWQVVTALLLAAGNILGGYWAYQTLGWGGYWGWDPVENSSLIPWVISMAVLHGLILQKRVGALKKTNILLTVLVFLSVVYGTFLTRSGVLADFSVHSFVDLGTNIFLIGFMVLFLAGALVLFFYRIRSLGHTAINYNVYGREFFLFVGMAVLFLFGLMVLTWTSLPLITTLLAATPRAADIDTYNTFALPLAALIALLLTFSLNSTATAFTPPRWKLRLIAAVVLSAAAGVGLVLTVPVGGPVFVILLVITVTTLVAYLSQPKLPARLILPLVIAGATALLAVGLGMRHPLHLLFLFTATTCIVSSISSLARRLPNGWRKAGSQLAHLGFGVMIAGVLLSSAYSTSEQVTLSPDSEQTAYGLKLKYLGMDNDITHPKNKLTIAVDDGGVTRHIKPELFYSSRLEGLMKRPHIDRSWLYDLYYAPQQVLDGDDPDGLLLSRGESRQVGDYGLTFVNFVMEQHQIQSHDLQVVALLRIEGPDRIDTIAPALTATEAAGGGMTSTPAYFGENDEYEVTLERILADRSEIVIRIPGLTPGGTGERLVLDISKKPGISLVWIGTTLLLLGLVLAFNRRRAEVPH
ncbi:MAG: cytochrome c biogenesis protein CcsA [bacterium]